MIEHVSLRCSDSRKSRDFYRKVLAPLGYTLSKEYGDAFGFKQGGRHDFWISAGKVGTPNHLAFTSATREAVDAFYRAALDAGGRDNGPPGDRKGYGYAAFVFDRDDHNVEAICFDEIEEGSSLQHVQRKRIAQATRAPKRRATPASQRASKATPAAKAKAKTKATGKRSTSRTAAGGKASRRTGRTRRRSRRGV